MVAIKTILNLLDKQDNRIKELESDKEIKDKTIEEYETIFKRQEELEQERKMLIKQGVDRWI